jgi:endonuclease/exonuclease/phosphatase family metal-dependent hydrolase
MVRAARPPSCPDDRMSTREDPALACVSWNIHRGKGNDGRVDPVRTVDVLLTEVAHPGTDILVLQEADEECRPHRGLLDIPRVEAETGLRHAHADERLRWGTESHGFLGVILFMDPDIMVEDVALLDLPGHCHRGAVVIDANRDGRAFRVIGTHLSLGQPARIAQMRVIGQHLRRRSARQTLLIGDLNEWRPWGGLALSPRVLGHTLQGPARASFPVKRPFLPLDRILTTAPGRVDGMRALDGPGIRLASDHRPVAARVSLGDGAGAARSSNEH